MAEHLFKRRVEARKYQRDVARELRVNTYTYLLWETGKTNPTIRHYPKIFRFLGYDPFPSPISLGERIKAKRRNLGLSIDEASRRIGVDEGTLRRWETGEWQPKKGAEALDRFFRMSQRDA